MSPKFVHPLSFGRLKRAVTLIVLLTAALVVSVAQAAPARPSTPVPAAPAGYSWTQLPEARAWFLRPGKWHTEHESGFDDDTSVLHITRENVGNGLSGLGLYVSVTPRLPLKKVQSTIAETITQSAIDGTIDRRWTEKRGLFRGEGAQITFRQDGSQWKRRLVVLVNETTHTIYSIGFESPAREWPQQRTTAETMTGTMRLDERY